MEKLGVNMPSLEINMQSIDSIQKSEVHDLKQVQHLDKALMIGCMMGCKKQILWLQ